MGISGNAPLVGDNFSNGFSNGSNRDLFVFNHLGAEANVCSRFGDRNARCWVSGQKAKTTHRNAFSRSLGRIVIVTQFVNITVNLL